MIGSSCWPAAARHTCASPRAHLLVCFQAGCVSLSHYCLHLLHMVLLSQHIIRGLLQHLTLQVSPTLQALSLSHSTNTTPWSVDLMCAANWLVQPQAGRSHTCTRA